MPKFDKRRSLEVPLEFNAIEDFTDLPCLNHVTFVLITDGKVIVSINGAPKTLIAPCVLCLSHDDKIKTIENKRLYAQSFSLNPFYLRNRMTYKTIKTGISSSSEEIVKDVLNLFYYRASDYNGILDLPPDAYIKIFEWMAVIGTEITAQSDGRWTCRVRAYFLRILNLLDEVYDSRIKESKHDKKSSNVDAVLEYLHTHYMDDEITLEILCKHTHTNRTTLNKSFKERTGQTVIAYLLNYRLRVATELLAHTGLTIDEIARASGFMYDTYLIKQFTDKSGQTPTEYRKEAQQKYGIVIQKE